MSPWHLYCQLCQEGEGISFRRGVPGGRCRLAGIEVLGREQRGHRLQVRDTIPDLEMFSDLEI